MCNTVINKERFEMSTPLPIADFQDYLLYTNQFDEYVENGICPNDGGQLERIYDQVSIEPTLTECTEVKCTECDWSDNDN